MERFWLVVLCVGGACLIAYAGCDWRSTVIALIIILIGVFLFLTGVEPNCQRKENHSGRGSVGKITVLGMRERGGRTFAKPIGERTVGTIQGEIFDKMEVGSKVYTDDHASYESLDGLFYKHATVNHSAGEYARGPVSTNSIESVWAGMKRGIHGVYHQVSEKHLARYVNEFTFRLNDGNVARHTMERLDSFVDAVKGKRITYQELTA